MNNVSIKIRLTDVFNQVWEELRGDFMQTIRDGIESLLEEARDSIVNRSCRARGAAGVYRSGYRTRKVFDTSIGSVDPLRIPRVLSAGDGAEDAELLHSESLYLGTMPVDFVQNFRKSRHGKRITWSLQ